MTLTPPDPRAAMVVANVSGGKDSTALSLHLAELGIEHRRVFADTGWEHPDTYAYLDEVGDSAKCPTTTDYIAAISSQVESVVLCS